MAGLENSKSKIFAKKESGFQPYQHIQSMGDDFIGDLVHQQRDTQYSLGRLLCEEKEFQSSHNFKPITEFNEGTSSLQSFVSHVAAIEPPVSQTSDTPNDPFLGLSRHEFEILQSVKPNSESTRLLTFALANKKSKNSPAGPYVAENHPINHLQDIHDSVFTDGDPQKTAKTILRKRKQLLEYYGEPSGPEPKCSKPSSLWDVKDPIYSVQKQYTVAPPPSGYKDSNSKANNSTNAKSAHSTKITSGFGKSIPKIVTKRKGISDEISHIKNSNENCIQKTSESQSPQEKKKQDSGGQPFVAPTHCQLSEVELRLIPRFTEDEIRTIPRFQNWSRGKPSKSLYIKNLSHSVTDLDLASIFQHYQDPKVPHIVYRLMKTGKMRGQAFVDFHSIDVAEKALNERNGLALKDKPIVIQFARNKD